MAQIVLVTGKRRSGATEWASRWYGENPDGRRIARTPQDAATAITAGHVPAIVIENLTDGHERKITQEIRKELTVAPLQRIHVKVVQVA